MKIIIKENKVVNLIDTIIKRNYPNFRKGIAIEKETYDPTDLEVRTIVYLNPDDDDMMFAAFFFKSKRIMLDYHIYEKLENILGRDLAEYFIPWFNNEFNKNAQKLSF